MIAPPEPNTGIRGSSITDISITHSTCAMGWRSTMAVEAVVMPGSAVSSATRSGDDLARNSPRPKPSFVTRASERRRATAADTRAVVIASCRAGIEQ